MKTMMKTVFGSHLYGLSTPTSDRDYKGIFIPTKREIILGGREVYNESTGGKGKNGADDIDTEMMSLRQFIKLASKGETMCIDMLHSNQLLETSPYWEVIQQNRSMFYTTRMDAFLGYCRKQATKYGVKGTRLAALERVMTVISNIPQSDMNYRLRYFVDRLPTDEFTFSGTEVSRTGETVEFYEVLGRKYLYGIKITEFIQQVQKIWEEYGDRAKRAKEEVGVDWKALSHAIRGGEQLLEIYRTGDLKFPLKHREFILDVKLGKRSLVDEVNPYLEQLMNDVEKEVVIARKNGMRETVNREYWDDFVYEVYLAELLS
ncbi:hypothetical protein phiAS5_ORF0256 [Aeromonas phage phiAS5]|uniref:Thioredoxin n=1 Tax=Aeromonas phage phiAS5 TaxID=879630 RepID=E1A210_9CAUD|nr:nucleotidyltransferase [Aeromonas phage phiAS5]ADM80099.1 hypothetical protein phiAS5_ORF0256 [Aeromonas phage phiAS5]BES53138.1 nucleotidyltransferase domain-containing protein [Aeromonas phage phiWae14]